MQLSTVIGTLALLLAAALVAGHALGEDALPPASAPTIQKKVDEREAQRRAAAADQEKKRQYFAKHCSKRRKLPTTSIGKHTTSMGRSCEPISMPPVPKGVLLMLKPWDARKVASLPRSISVPKVMASR